MAWLNAGALLAFGIAISYLFAATFPILLELAARSPRLGWAGILVVWLTPIPAGAIAHRALHRVLDATGDRARATMIQSWWAGLFAWAAILFVTLTTSFVLLVIDPPPVEPEALLRTALSVTSLSPSVHTIVWIVVAAFVAHLERASRRE